LPLMPQVAKPSCQAALVVPSSFLVAAAQAPHHIWRRCSPAHHAARAGSPLRGGWLLRREVKAAGQPQGAVAVDAAAASCKRSQHAGRLLPSVDHRRGVCFGRLWAAQLPSGDE
jgi:hypothetical protein